jgi:hypothetical protein
MYSESVRRMFPCAYSSRIMKCALLPSPNWKRIICTIDTKRSLKWPNQQQYKAARYKWCLRGMETGKKMVFQKKRNGSWKNTLSYPSIRTSSSLLLRMCFRSLRVKPEGVVLLSLHKAYNRVSPETNVLEQGNSKKNQWRAVGSISPDILGGVKPGSALHEQ